MAAYLFELPDLDFVVSFGDTNICTRCETVQGRAMCCIISVVSIRAQLIRGWSWLGQLDCVAHSGRPWLTYTTSAEDPTCAAFLMPSYRTWSQVSSRPAKHQHMPSGCYPSPGRVLAWVLIGA